MAFVDSGQRRNSCTKPQDIRRPNKMNWCEYAKRAPGREHENMTSGLTETLLAPSDDTTQCHSLAAQLAKGLYPGLSIDTLSLFCRGEPCCPLQLEFNVDGELVWLVEPAATPQDNTDYFPLAGMGSSKASRTNEVAGRTTMGLFLLCDRGNRCLIFGEHRSFQPRVRFLFRHRLHGNLARRFRPWSSRPQCRTSDGFNGDDCSPTKLYFRLRVD